MNQPEEWEAIHTGEVLTAEERIRELQEEVRRGSPQTALTRFLSNPEGLSRQFNLTPAQVANVRAILGGAGAGFSIRVLGPIIGEQLAGALGGFLAPILARKIVGG